MRGWRGPQHRRRARRDLHVRLGRWGRSGPGGCQPASPGVPDRLLARRLEDPVPPSGATRRRLRRSHEPLRGQHPRHRPGAAESPEHHYRPRRHAAHHHGELDVDPVTRDRVLRATASACAAVVAPGGRATPTPCRPPTARCLGRGRPRTPSPGRDRTQRPGSRHRLPAAAPRTSRAPPGLPPRTRDGRVRSDTR